MAVNIGPQLMEVLSRYGLQEMAEWVSQRITAGASPEQIQLEMYDQPLFKSAFPEIAAREALVKGTGVTLLPLSPDQILTYRNQARSLMRAYGLPPSFWDRHTDFMDLIVNDVSIEELADRLDSASTRVHQAPPEVRAYFGELFGAASDDALFAIFVDVDRSMPELERMVQRAEVGGAARRFGFDLEPVATGRLAEYGINYAQAVEGFSTLDLQRGLFQETISEEEDLEAEEEGVEAVFGLDVESGAALRRRAETRTAESSGQAGGGQEERGVTSLGGAGRR